MTSLYWLYSLYWLSSLIRLVRFMHEIYATNFVLVLTPSCQATGDMWQYANTTGPFLDPLNMTKHSLHVTASENPLQKNLTRLSECFLQLRGMHQVIRVPDRSWAATFTGKHCCSACTKYTHINTLTHHSLTMLACERKGLTKTDVSSAFIIFQYAGCATRPSSCYVVSMLLTVWNHRGVKMLGTCHTSSSEAAQKDWMNW